MGMYDVKADSFVGEDEVLAERANRMMQETWNCIASDIFACNAEAGDDKPMKRAEVIEVVLDAGRMMDYAKDEIDKEACRYIIWLHWHKKAAYKRFLDKYWPYKFYC